VGDKHTDEELPEREATAGRPQSLIHLAGAPGGAGENRPLRLGWLARDGLFDDAHDQHEHSTADASAGDLFND
jgi:hypothetical protein